MRPSREEETPGFLESQTPAASSTSELQRKLAGAPAVAALSAPKAPAEKEAVAARSSRVSTYVNTAERYDLRARAAEKHLTVEEYIHAQLFPNAER